LHKRPVYSVDGDTVKKGCLAASTIDFHEIGVRTAEYVAFILAGSSPERLSAENFDKFHIVINRKVAKELMVDIPSSLQKRVTLISE
jgi:putative ABC transport system substrate-binding protein